MNLDQDFIWKLLIGGAGGVGKTTILHRYVHNEFLMDMKMTIGAQFHTMITERRGKKVGLSLWDLGGQERFRFILPNYCSGAKGAFILFDMTRHVTLEQARDWHQMFKENLPENTPMLLVGTKYDMVEDDYKERVQELGEQMKEDLGCLAFIVTSSLYGWNVKETIEYMVDYLLVTEGF